MSRDGSIGSNISHILYRLPNLVALGSCCCSADDVVWGANNAHAPPHNGLNCKFANCFSIQLSMIPDESNPNQIH